MTAAPPALPARAWNKRLKESHELTRLPLVKADMRVVGFQHLAPALLTVMPAEAGIQSGGSGPLLSWAHAFAGATKKGRGSHLSG